MAVMATYPSLACPNFTACCFLVVREQLNFLMTSRSTVIAMAFVPQRELIVPKLNKNGHRLYYEFVIVNKLLRKI